LLAGKRVEYPPPTQTNVTYKKASLAKTQGEQQALPFAAKKRHAKAR
jgi:hypothetical protein